MKKFALGLLAAACASALWASDTVRDEFFWLGEMNKATTVINTDEKLLDKAVVKKVAHGLQTVIANGNKQGGPRPKEVIKFEPFLIKEAGMDVTSPCCISAVPARTCTQRIALPSCATMCLLFPRSWQK